jgi:glycosyltransferase involved in cell wall biosynthesis
MNKKIDIIYFGNLKGIEGVALVIDRFIKNKEMFLKNCFEINAYTATTVEIRNNDKTKNKVTFIKRNFNRIIKPTLKNIIKSNKVLSIWSIYRTILYGAKKSVKKYFALKREPDVHFFHDIFTSYYFLKMRKIKKSKTILVIHSNGDTFSMLLGYYKVLNKTFFHKWLLKMEQFVIINIDLVGFVSEKSRDDFHKLHPAVRKESTFFINNGIDYSDEIENKIPNLPINLCCIGSLIGRKGQKIIIDAIHELSVEHKSKIKLTLVGGGDDLEKLEQLVKNYDLQKQIIFTGWKANIDAIKYINSCQIFILMSYDEGFPTVLLEAMRAGKPIISTNIAGIPEMVENNINGLLINPNVLELVPILSKIEEYNWKKMGRIGREKFENNFTIEIMINKYCTLFNKNLKK